MSRLKKETKHPALVLDKKRSSKFGKGNINTVGRGYYCHVVDGCDYYRGWNGEHPLGRSQLFNSDSGISVGISKEGASQIPEALDATSLQWGTDANAFAQLADEYFEQHKDALMHNHRTR